MRLFGPAAGRLLPAVVLLAVGPRVVRAQNAPTAYQPGSPDPVAAIELKGNADPTFDRVARHFPPMQNPREAIGVPDHPVDIGVDPRGRLQFSDAADDPKAPTAHLEIGAAPEVVDLTQSAPERRLEGGYLPIVVLSGRARDCTWEQTLFGWTEGLRPEGELYAIVRLRVRRIGAARLPVEAAVLASPGGQRIAAPLLPTRSGEAEAYWRIPFSAPARAETMPRVLFAKTHAEVGRFWRNLLNRGAWIETPERRVNDAWRAWLAYSFLDVDRHDGFDEPHDGAGFYEAVFGYSALLHCHALDLFGYPDRARRALAMALHYQQPDGLYTQNYGLPDQGALLFALAEHYRLTGDRAWLQSVAEPAVRAAEWLLRQRAATPARGMVAGLLKFRPYCDYGEPVYNYNSDTYCCVGLERAADMMEALGRSEDARRFRDGAARYREDILRSMDAAAFERDGRTIIPIEPETQRLEKASDYRGGEYYGLIASCLLENEFLPADDRRARAIADFIEQTGLIAGLSEFDSGIDHAYTYGYLLTRLKQGDARRVLLGFYGMLAYGMTRDTYSGVEVTRILTGHNYSTLPHLYSCTQQLRLLRYLLLREDGDTLRIGEAVPRHWLARGQRVLVRSAPTRFGNVSFTVRAGVTPRRIAFWVDPPRRAAPKRIVVRLRQSEGRPIRGVRFNGRVWKRFQGEEIDIPTPSRPVQLVACF